MSNIIVTPDGKKIKATENIDDLIQVGIEALDENRAGIIDNSTLKARATAISSVVSILRTAIVYQQLTSKSGEIHLTFIEPVKKIEQKNE